MTVRLPRHLAATAPAPAHQCTGTGPPPVDPLTDRELEVTRDSARRRTNRQIAAELFISLSTVNSHVSTIQTKLNMANPGGGGRLGLGEPRHPEQLPSRVVSRPSTR